jgi:urease accessory protein
LSRGGWRGALDLGFSAEGGATWLARRAHQGPFLVQRPFFPEGPGVCHVYVLHPPGGLVGGDELRLGIEVDAGGHVLLTTPAAGKAYRTTGAPVLQAQRITVGAGAALEWLPQETILYDGADATLETEVHLARGARFIGAETVCFGLAARAETFARGVCRQRIELRRRDGESASRPLFIERGRFGGGEATQAARWGLGGATVMALFVAAPAPAEALVASLREELASEFVAGTVGATVVGDGPDSVLVCRFVGASAERARVFVQRCWCMVRPVLLGRPAIAPRIWAT